jgi:Na+-translocating ferredoxin:NAD+ oxidoreductase RNF subunit RnfB
MSDIVLYTILTISTVGIVSAMILYFAAQKFKVYEDPRIDQVEEALPKANCGGCGYPGCRNFAEACVKAETLDGLFCPVGGNTTMVDVAGILGKVAAEQAPRVAVIRCNGQPQFRARVNEYSGPANCSIEHIIGSGDTACQFGCLGGGDCVEACTFEAMRMNPETMLPEVIDDLCTACGACVDACPRDIIELRTKAKKDRKIFVSCVSQEKGVNTKKACEVGCIACTKCVKECAYDAIVITNNLAFIDADKCRLCRKCVDVCPTNSILEIGFPPRRTKVKETSDDNSGDNEINA